MDQFIKVTFLLFGLSFVYFLASSFLYNIIGDFFQFESLSLDSYELIDESKNTTKVIYTYNIGEQNFDNKVRVYSKLLEEVTKGQKLIIEYNTTFPSFSYVKGIRLDNKHYIGIGFSIFVLILASVAKVKNSMKKPHSSVSL